MEPERFWVYLGLEDHVKQVVAALRASRSPFVDVATVEWLDHHDEFDLSTRVQADAFLEFALRAMLDCTDCPSDFRELVQHTYELQAFLDMPPLPGSPATTPKYFVRLCKALAARATGADAFIPVKILCAIAFWLIGPDWTWVQLHMSLIECAPCDHPLAQRVAFAGKCTFYAWGLLHHAHFGRLESTETCGMCVRAMCDIPAFTVIGIYPGYVYTEEAYDAYVKRMAVSEEQIRLRDLYSFNLRSKLPKRKRAADLIYDATEDHEVITLDERGSRVPTHDKPFEFLMYMNESTKSPPNVHMVTAPSLLVYAVTSRDVGQDEELTLYYGDHYPREGYKAVAPTKEVETAVAKYCQAVGVDARADQTSTDVAPTGFHDMIRAARDKYARIYTS